MGSSARFSLRHPLCRLLHLPPINLVHVDHDIPSSSSVLSHLCLSHPICTISRLLPRLYHLLPPSSTSSIHPHPLRLLAVRSRAHLLLITHRHRYRTEISRLYSILHSANITHNDVNPRHVRHLLNHPPSGPILRLIDFEASTFHPVNDERARVMIDRERYEIERIVGYLPREEE